MARLEFWPWPLTCTDRALDPASWHGPTWLLIKPPTCTDRALDLSSDMVRLDSWPRPDMTQSNSWPIASRLNPTRLLASPPNNGLAWTWFNLLSNDLRKLLISFHCHTYQLTSADICTEPGTVVANLLPIVWEGGRHGLINYICRHLKLLTCNGTLRHAFITVYFINWRYSQSCWYFRPSFVKCCPANLLSGSTVPPPPFPVLISILYTGIQCVKWGGGLWGSGPQTDKHLPQSPQSFLDDDILHWLLWVLSFYGGPYLLPEVKF